MTVKDIVDHARGEFMFGYPTTEDFVAPYTIELIEEWRSA